VIIHSVQTPDDFVHGVDTGGKQFDLGHLGLQLTDAGIAHNALGRTPDGRLHTYDGNGIPIDFEDMAAVAVALTQYVPPVPPPNPMDILGSLLPYTDGPDDLKDLLAMMFQVQAPLFGPSTEGG
jgi:hypothetical protein